MISILIRIIDWEYRMGNFTNRDILDNDTNYAKQNKMRNSKQFLSILIALSLSACSSKDDSIFSDFTRTVDLQLLDSLDWRRWKFSIRTISTIKIAS